MIPGEFPLIFRLELLPEIVERRFAIEPDQQSPESLELRKVGRLLDTSKGRLEVGRSLRCEGERNVRRPIDGLALLAVRIDEVAEFGKDRNRPSRKMIADDGRRVGYADIDGGHHAEQGLVGIELALFLGLHAAGERQAAKEYRESNQSFCTQFTATRILGSRFRLAPTGQASRPLGSPGKTCWLHC